MTQPELGVITTDPRGDAVFARIAAEWEATGRSETYEQLLRLEYTHPPVDVVTFVESPEFLGMKNQAFPRILDDLARFFHGDRRSTEYQVAILMGAIGWGKSFWAELALLYGVYVLSCYRDPQTTFGLAAGSPLWIVNVSVSKKQAMQVIFRRLKTKMQRSRYFREVFRYDKWVESELRFPREILVSPRASMEQDVLGLDVFMACVDETNFMPVVEKSKMARGRSAEDHYDHAVTLTDALTGRQQSRFNVRGRVEAKLVLVSSSQYPDDFTERKAKEALDNPRILVLRYTQWETKPRRNFLPQTFRVELGDAFRMTRILAEGEAPRPDAKVREVPADFRPAFETNMERSVREILGETVEAIEPFIRRREAIAAAVDPGRKHPFPRHVLVSGQGFPLDVAALCVQTERGLRPRWHPACPRTAHVDLALTRDKCGLSMGCSPGQKRVVRLDPQTGQRFEDSAPLLWYDVLVEIAAPPGGEIDIAEVRDLLELLRRHGFRLALVTYDSFASEESIQQWRKRGVRAETLSVDTDLEAYEALKTGLYEGRVSTYESPPLHKQLVELEIDHQKQRVDHRPHGSKDLSDAVAAVAKHWTFGLVRFLPPPSPGVLVGSTPSLPIDEDSYEWLMKD